MGSWAGSAITAAPQTAGLALIFGTVCLGLFPFPPPFFHLFPHFSFAPHHFQGSGVLFSCCLYPKGSWQLPAAPHWQGPLGSLGHGDGQL